MNLDVLPEDCFAHIVSLTSPEDACRLSLVSSMVHSMADLDSVWEGFLPSDYKGITSRLVTPVVYSTNKELFMRLCTPRLIDGGRKMKHPLGNGNKAGTLERIGFSRLYMMNRWWPIAHRVMRNYIVQWIIWILFPESIFVLSPVDALIFSIEKSTRNKCCVLGARELSITWATNPLYWTWTTLPGSRFAEVAELRTIWWLEICGVVNTQILSPKTVYGAYLIVKFAGRAYGLDNYPSEVSVQVGNITSQGQVYLSLHEAKKQALENAHCLSRYKALRSKVSQGEREALCERKDGWVEIELGSFYNDGNDKEVKMCLKEVKGQHLRGGLIVEGIELRPKRVV